VIAIIRNYDDLRRALRAHCEQVNITRQELDARTGLADGHSGKLLGPRAVKGFGRVSLTWLLEALDLELVLRRRNDTATEAFTEASLDAQPAPQDWRRNRGPRWGKRMNARRALSLTRDERSAIARKAAHARWQRRANPPEPSA
jgi:hypothetical protein